MNKKNKAVVRKVLIITSILPIQEIPHKRDENDILLVTEEELKKRYRDIEFKYVFLYPRVPLMLSFISAKWKAYFKLRRKNRVSLRGREIHAISVYSFRRFGGINRFLFQLSMFLERKKLARIVSDFRPNVVHAQNFAYDAHLANWINLRYKIPFILTSRELDSTSNCKCVSDYILRAKQVITLNNTQKQIVESIQETEKVQLIPHGISQIFFNKPKTDLPILNKIRILSACRLIKLKQIDTVIHALSRIGPFCDYDFDYNIYGDGPEKEALINLVGNLGLSHKIKFHGHIDYADMPDVYKRHDLFVMPSYPEALGRVYLESMATGVPVIACEGTGIDGIVQDGINGFLVPPNDIPALQNIFEAVMCDSKLLVGLGKRARSTVEEFTWDNICHKLSEVYNS